MTRGLGAETTATTREHSGGAGEAAPGRKGWWHRPSPPSQEKAPVEAQLCAARAPDLTVGRSVNFFPLWTVLTVWEPHATTGRG